MAQVLEQFFSIGDAGRLERAFLKLASHDIRPWVLTGGLAVELHHELHGHGSSLRSLNDLDFLVGSFDDLPESLARDYLFRHVHPFDPPGKTILQAIDPEQTLRIDVFRVYSGCLDRACEVPFGQGTVRLISREDLTARTARLVMDLVESVPVPAKHAQDFLRLVKLVNTAAMDAIWQEHRKPNHPACFTEVKQRLEEAILARAGLLITPQYSTNVSEVCPRCAPTACFRLANAETVLSLLGYC